MILITGSLLATPASVDELLVLALEHVRRSRTEDGCLSHAVHRDVEEPNRLVFVERWRDRAAVDAHFAVPASGAFVARASRMVQEPPTIEVLEVVPG